MNLQIFGRFIISADAIPYYFSLILLMITPFLYRFIREAIIPRNLPTGLHVFRPDIEVFAFDAVRRVGLITSAYIAIVNSLHLTIRSGGCRIHAGVLCLVLTIFVFFILPRISVYDWNRNILGIQAHRWAWLFSIAINIEVLPIVKTILGAK